MSTDLRPARVAPPGRIIKRELDARGWTQKDLAEIMGRPPQAVSEIVQGRKQITPETALQLAAAFGTSPELWINLETNYRLYQAREEHDKAEIARKSRLYSLAPISELTKRAWIRDAGSVEELEQEICAFLEIDSPNQQPRLTASFRHTQAQEPEVNAQVAWVRRVEHLASAQNVGEFDRVQIQAALPDLLACTSEAEDVARVPALLQSLGIHFVIVPHLPYTYLDGAAFTFAGHPVTALTLRHDRIDSFWFTLLHELAHIVAGHEGLYLDNLDERDGSDVEAEANQLAQDWLIDPKAFAEFVAATRPYFSGAKITAFAQSQERHPGIVLGRLHYEGLVPYKNLRTLLVKVKPRLAAWIDTSGPV